MELFGQIFDIVLHLDKHLAILVENYGIWVYAILFAIIFMETGLVVTPFLPGDSLLFVTGAIAAVGGIDPWYITLTLIIAALCGDNLNYWIGFHSGAKIFNSRNSRFLNQKNLSNTHTFMEKHGPKAIIIARFVPIIRTFVPFVCGIGRLTYPRFLGFSCLGALLWVGSLVPLGYFFGNIPVIKNNLSIVILAIIAISILPGLIEIIRHNTTNKNQRP